MSESMRWVRLGKGGEKYKRGVLEGKRMRKTRSERWQKTTKTSFSRPERQVKLTKPSIELGIHFTWLGLPGQIGLAGASLLTRHVHTVTGWLPDRWARIEPGAQVNMYNNLGRVVLTQGTRAKGAYNTAVERPNFPDICVTSLLFEPLVTVQWENKQVLSSK